MDIHVLIQKLSKRTASDDIDGVTLLDIEEEDAVLGLLEEYVELINEHEETLETHMDEVEDLNKIIKKLEADNKKLQASYEKLKREDKVKDSAKALQQLLNNG